MTIANYTERILLGPGPSNIHPRVFQAMATPLLGYLDAEFVQAMDETVSLLKQTYRTANPLTFAVPGTGSAGMETALANILERGDTVVVGTNGYFGLRLGEVARRYGASVVEVKGRLGAAAKVEDIKSRVETLQRRGRKVKAIAVVHVETSTGAYQPGEEIRELANVAHEAGALLLMDTVSGLGGMDVRVDEWGVDVAYSCTQKGVGAPPGLSPFTMSPRAVEVMENRKRPAESFYFDASLLHAYWDPTRAARAYHHTAPNTMIYALREALRLIQEEGLDARIERHSASAKGLRAGLRAMGLRQFAAAGYQSDTLISVRVPEGIDPTAVRGHLLSAYGMEIGGPLPISGLRGGAPIWRIGLMGYNSKPGNVLLVLHALGDALSRNGFSPKTERGVAAASKALTGR